MDLSLSLFRFPYQIFARPHRSDATLLHLFSTASVLPVLAYFKFTRLVNILLWNHFLLKYPPLPSLHPMSRLPSRLLQFCLRTGFILPHGIIRPQSLVVVVLLIFWFGVGKSFILIVESCYQCKIVEDNKTIPIEIVCKYNVYAQSN